MSHNTTKVLSTSPSVTGAYSVALGDLTDVSTYTDGQALVYDDATQTWGGAPMPSPKERIAVFGQGGADDYANCGFALSAGSTVGFYDPSPVNNISDKVTFNYVAGTGWLQSVTLQAGKYEIFAQTGFLFSALGYVSYRWVNASNAWRGSLGVIGETTTYGGATTYTIGALSLSAEDTLRVAILNTANPSAAQGNFPAIRGMISIKELS